MNGMNGKYESPEGLLGCVSANAEIQWSCPRPICVRQMGRNRVAVCVATLLQHALISPVKFLGS